MQSDAESVKTQLDNLNARLTDEKKNTEKMLDEQNTELEEAKKKASEGQEQRSKMQTRMTELQNELEQTIKRIE